MSTKKYGQHTPAFRAGNHDGLAQMHTGPTPNHTSTIQWILRIGARGVGCAV